MRLLRTFLLVLLLLIVVLAGCVVWLGRFDEGSRWLVQKGLAMLPVETAVTGISGSLVGGLSIDRLDIILDVAEIRVDGVSVFWDPLGLFVGDVVLDSASVHSLEVIPLAPEESEPPDDALFWLQLPLDIRVNSGRVDRLQIAAARFHNIRLAGILGRGRLDVLQLAGEIEGVNVAADGRLEGPAPGKVRAAARWTFPAQDFSGRGTFEGSIDTLNFVHAVSVPGRFGSEPLQASGIIRDLFAGPTLEGNVSWTELAVPAEEPLRVRQGEVRVESDFQTAALSGGASLVLQGWPDAPVELQAFTDTSALRIDSFSLGLFGGAVAGDGQINFRDGLEGELNLRASSIDTAKIRTDLPGMLDFTAAIRIESPDTLTIKLLSADGVLAGRRLSGAGNAAVRGGKLHTAQGTVKAGANRLEANLDFSSGLAGVASLSAPEPGLLVRGLQGRLDASLRLTGTSASPAGAASVQASDLVYAGQAIETLTVDGSLAATGELSGSIAASNIRTGERQLGDLTAMLMGRIDDHALDVELRNGLVDIALATTGAWRDERLTETVVSGRVESDGIEAWDLAGPVVLEWSAARGSIGAHCWSQSAAQLCFGEGNISPEGGAGTLALSDFPLASLQPFLPEGYGLDGSIDLTGDLRLNDSGLYGKLRWRQKDTALSYIDEASEFSAVLDHVNLDVDLTPEAAELGLSIRGDDSLSAEGKATVAGPFGMDSRLVATFAASVPDAALLRPLLQSIAGAGAIGGQLSADLKVTGTVGSPIFEGGGALRDGLVELPDLGIVLRNIGIRAESAGYNRLRIAGELQSGQGAATISGDMTVDETEGVAAVLSLRGENLETVRMPELSVDSSPDLSIRIGPGQFDIAGTVLIPRATAELRDLPQSAVPRSPDVIVHAPDRAAEDRSTIVTGEVEVQLGKQVRFSGFGLESRLEGSLRLVQKRQGALRGFGTVRVRDGFLNGYGKELRVDRGDLTFTGPLDDPAINIQVSRDTIYEARQYTVGLQLSGTASNVRTEPYSRPAMTEQDVLSFLLLDRPASTSGEDTGAGGAALALGLGKIVPGGDGVTSKLGIDELGFEGSSLEETAVVAGKRINDRLYVRYVFGIFGQPGAFRVRYRLGRGFSLEASSGSSQALDLIYLLEK